MLIYVNVFTVEYNPLKTVLLIITLNGNIQKDKALHLCAGSFISTGARTAGLTYWQSAAVGSGVGIGKELIYDKLLHRGTPSWQDALATSLGSLVNFKITIHGRRKAKVEKG